MSMNPNRRPRKKQVEPRKVCFTRLASSGICENACGTYWWSTAHSYLPHQITCKECMEHPFVIAALKKEALKDLRDLDL